MLSPDLLELVLGQLSPEQLDRLALVNWSLFRFLQQEPLRLRLLPCLFDLARTLSERIRICQTTIFGAQAEGGVLSYCYPSYRLESTPFTNPVVPWGKIGQSLELARTASSTELDLDLFRRAYSERRKLIVTYLDLRPPFLVTHIVQPALTLSTGEEEIIHSRILRPTFIALVSLVDCSEGIWLSISYQPFEASLPLFSKISTQLYTVPTLEEAIQKIVTVLPQPHCRLFWRGQTILTTVPASLLEDNPCFVVYQTQNFAQIIRS